MIIDTNNCNILQPTAQFLVKEALSKGYGVEFFPSAPSAKSGVIRCEKDDREIFFKNLNTSLTPSYGVFVAEDMYLMHSLLSGRGLPMPKTVAIAPGDAIELARDLLVEVHEVVVKPVTARHGNAAVAATIEELEQAIKNAQSIGGDQLGDVIVQERLKGKEYRFLVLEEKVIAIAGRDDETIDYTTIATKEIKQLASDAAHASHLGIAGVDIITTDIANGSAENSWIIEVNASPDIEMHHSTPEEVQRDVVQKIFNSLEASARPIGKNLIHIGRVEDTELPLLGSGVFKARVDTGATSSSIWASNIRVDEAGLHFVLFGLTHAAYTGIEHTFSEYSTRRVRSSNGREEERYQIITTVVIKNKRVRAKMTLADRSTQMYPMLIGRNVIRGRFIVDVLRGAPDKKAESDRQKEGNLNGFANMPSHDKKEIE